MFLAADSKAGKSTLLLQMIRGLVEGSDFIGFKVKKPLKVLYMQAELRETRLKQRLAPTAWILPPEVQERCVIWSTRGMVLFDVDEREIHRVLAEIGPDIVIIDPMANFHSGDENSSQEVMRFLRKLDSMKEAHNVGLIISHHFRKASVEEKKDTSLSLLERIRGSSALRGWADATLAISGRQGDHSQTLEFELRNSDETHRRVLYYNRKLKCFDWKDPIDILSEWVKTELTGKSFSTEQLVKKMLEDHRELVGNNRAKAFHLKDALIEKGGIPHPIVEGNKKVFRL